MTSLDPSLLRRLEVLRRHLVSRARSGGVGERTSGRRGSSAEFRDHRAYAPGDDPRRIDWAAYARTDEPVVKLYRAEEDVVVRVAIDTSRSMDHGAPSKREAARAIGAAVGYLALARGERAELLGVDAGHAPRVSFTRGRSGVASLLRSLEALPAGGTAGLAQALPELLRRAGRPGWLVLVSDFLEPAALMGPLGAARAAGHDVALVQVLSPDELDPTLDGDLTLEDAESGEALDVSVDPTTLAAYARRLANLCDELRGCARRLGGTYVRARSDEPLESVMDRFVARSLD